MQAFSFTCRLCQQKIELPKPLKGKRGKCPYCQESVVYATETVDCSKPFYLKRNDRCLGPFMQEELEHFQLFHDDYVGQTYNGPWYLVADTPSLSTGKNTGARQLPTEKKRFAKPLISNKIKRSLGPLFETEQSEPTPFTPFIPPDEGSISQISTKLNERSSQEASKTKVIIAPNLVCNFSLIFGPFFGAFLHAKNWRALKKPKVASKTWYWAFAAYGIGWLIAFGFSSEFSHHNNSAPSRVGYLFAVFLWYFAAGRPHVKYCERLTSQLKREGRASDWVEVGIPAYAFLLFITIALLLGFIVFFSQSSF